MTRTRMLVALLALPWLHTGCVLGSEQDPGCRPDRAQDCPSTWTCRAGVCLRPTTPLSPAADAGDAADRHDVNPDDAEGSED